MEVTMFTCQICAKELRRGDNMRRYLKTVHADFKDDETIHYREKPEIIDEDDASDKADDDEPNVKDKAETDDGDIDVEEVGEAAEEEEEEEEDKEEDSDDPWHLLIEEAFERYRSEFDERVTKHMARQGVGEELSGPEDDDDDDTQT